MAAGRGARRKAPRNMHDSYLRAILEAPERAADFLRYHLPACIVGLFADRPPELVDGALLGDDLRNRQIDRLFRVWLRSGEYIFVIVEHASKVDPEMASRLLHYRLPIWDREKEASDVKPGRRIPILALVVYHGKAPWTAPLSLPGMMTGDPAFHDMTGGDSALGERISGGGNWLLDIGRMREDQLGDNPDLKGGLLALQHAYRGPVGSRVLRRIRELISEGTKFERQTYQYILDAFDADMDTILAAFETKGATTMRALAHSVVGKAHAEGVAEGEARGEARGEILGRASILNRLLERRFGRLPATVRERVRTASVQDLDAWGDAVLDAPTLKAVFEATPRH